MLEATKLALNSLECQHGWELVGIYHGILIYFRQHLDTQCILWCSSHLVNPYLPARFVLQILAYVCSRARISHHTRKYACICMQNTKETKKKWKTQLEQQQKCGKHAAPRETAGHVPWIRAWPTARLLYDFICTPSISILPFHDKCSICFLLCRTSICFTFLATF